MYIPRQITDTVKKLAHNFPVVTLTGPRQSGKSTLLKTNFPEYTYVSLENTDTRDLALSDPRGFLHKYKDKVIIDEIQRVPQLLSYIQTHVDNYNNPGMFFLAGSQSFLLMQNISQSLAGRTALLTLLPFSRSELHDADLLPNSINQQIFHGFYPRTYQMEIEPIHFYSAYVQTYVERDVRDILNVTDLNKFNKFIKLCAGRVGQILNMTALATETGISSTTAEGWLSVLEASYICYRLQPFYKNFNKRIIKSPKLYFYDTGLVSFLLGLTSFEQLDNFYLRGGLFENLVINQFLKDCYNKGHLPHFSFWRDSSGNEIDLIIENGVNLDAYEIKSSSTFHGEFFKNLDKWAKLSGIPNDNLNVIYSGEENMKTKQGNIISFHDFF